MFQLAFNTDAHSLSPTGHVALARTASLNVIAFPLEEPLKDLSTPQIVSLMGGHGNFALCFTQGIGASPEWSDMIRIVARSMWSCFPSGQSGRAHVLFPGSVGSGSSPASLTCGSEVVLVLNEGILLDLAGHEADLRFRPCLLRCACSCAQTQPFTMPMPILTKKDWATNVWHERVSVSVLDTACVGVCGGVRRVRREPKLVLVQGLSIREETCKQIR